MARFTFNDAVWNRYNGNFINLNGLLAAMAKEIWRMKQPAQSEKKAKEKKNREDKSKKLKQSRTVTV